MTRRHSPPPAETADAPPARPRLLDLYCGAGGAGMGYHRAGFDVVGVDIEPQPSYPFTFVQGDALAYLEVHAGEFDAVHASPPCQRWSNAGTTRTIGDGHPDLLGPTRDAFERLSIPWAIENIPLAPMPAAFVLCGQTFGLPIIRHRQFETSLGFVLVPSACPQDRFASAGGGHPGTYPYAQGSWEAAWREIVIPAVWPWMKNVREAGLAIPPAYTEWIGAQLLGQIDPSRVRGRDQYLDHRGAVAGPAGASDVGHETRAAYLAAGYVALELW